MSNVLEKIEAAQYPIIQVPFHGKQIFVKLRKLTLNQINNCGNISLIETFQDKIKTKNLKMRDVIKYSEAQHKLVKSALVEPSYDDIIKTIGNNSNIEQKKKELDELKIKCHSLKPGKERRALEEEIDSYKIWINLILPYDFIGAVVSFALGINESSIKEVSEKTLMEAAIIAEKYKKRPSDIICEEGNFSVFNKLDIDKRAMQILYEYREKNKKNPVKKGRK